MARRAAFAGFTYIGLLLLVAMMGFALTVVSQVWQTKQKRDKEDELLFVGNQFRQAIGVYHASTPGGGARFPRSLEDLLLDPRFPGVRRYLRRIYRDPVTGRAEWGLVRTGELIIGVYSLSDDEPLKKAGFGGAERSFEDKTKYSEWVFLSRYGEGVAAGPSGAPGAPDNRPPTGSGGAPLRAAK